MTRKSYFRSFAVRFVRFQHDENLGIGSLLSINSRIQTGFSSEFGFEEMRLFLAAQFYHVAWLSSSLTQTEKTQFVWNCIKWKSGFLKLASKDFQILLIHILKIILWIQRGRTIMIKSRGNEANHNTIFLKTKHDLVRFPQSHTVYDDQF